MSAPKSVSSVPSSNAAPPDAPVAVVTGASSGIGAATARALAAEGWHVVCLARRRERIEALAASIGGRAVACDITDAGAVDAVAETVGRCDLLVNNAGGALGVDPVAEADLALWRRMYELNVVGTTRVTQALLPALRAAEGGRGQVVVVTSTAAEAGYEGGAGYCGVKAAERSMVQSLRLELCGEPVRVCEIAPGMVHTEEFSLVRLGDAAAAQAVYAGVPDPLVAEDVAECIAFVASRPAHVNVDRLLVRPRAQAAQFKIDRR